MAEAKQIDLEDLLAAKGGSREEKYVSNGNVLLGALPEPTDLVLGVRDLTEDDLIELEVTRRAAKPSTYDIPAVRERHHEIARMIVLGFPQKHIGETLGIRPSTISNIKKSPGMQQLIAYYQEKRDAATVSDPAARMRLVAFEGLGRLRQVVADEDADPALVQKITADMLDRTGHPAVQRSETTNTGGLSDDEINSIKEIARQGSARTLPSEDTERAPALLEGSTEGGASGSGGPGQDFRKKGPPGA